MGLYAFFLAGSNYFAPVICGFIADHQGKLANMYGYVFVRDCLTIFKVGNGCSIGLPFSAL